MFTKTTTILLATAAVANAFSADFLQGAQTGVFLSSEDMFEDYSCPLPEMDAQLENMINMIAPFKMMVQNMSGTPKTETNPFVPIIETLEGIAHQVGYLASLFTTDYDGGEFCLGLVASKEASMLMFQLFGNVFQSFMAPTATGELNPLVASLL